MGLALDKARETALGDDDVHRHPELARYRGQPAVLVLGFRDYQ